MSNDNLIRKARNALAVFRFLTDEPVSLSYWGGRELYIENDGRVSVYKAFRTGGLDVFYEGRDLAAALKALAGED